MGRMALLAMALLACAGERHAELIGSFSGSGVEVVLDQVDGELFYAEVRLGTEVYNRSAQYQDGVLVGSLDDFGQMPFTIRPRSDEGGVALELGGQTIHLARPGTNADLSGAGIAPGSGSRDDETGVSPQSGDRDPRLVGAWSRQEMISTPQGSIATQIFLTIDANGSFVESMGDTLGGGVGWNGQITGADGGQSAEWRTQDGVFLVRQTGTPWVPLARYVLEPGRLMFVYGDGSRHLWYRR